jgi:hypothetical protein
MAPKVLALAGGLGLPNLESWQAFETAPQSLHIASGSVPSNPMFALVVTLLKPHLPPSIICCCGSLWPENWAVVELAETQIG